MRNKFANVTHKKLFLHFLHLCFSDIRTKVHKYNKRKSFCNAPYEIFNTILYLN